MASMRTNRREFIWGAAAIGLASTSRRLWAANKAKSVFEAVELNHISLDVTHMERSREFYQSVFGMTPISHGRGGGASFLHFAEGFLNLRPADSAGMNHFCLSIKDFDVASVYTMLNALDLEPWVQGGGNLLHVRDPDGINVQVQEARHGWGRTGNQLSNADKGTFSAVRLHHVSLNVTDVARSRSFYEEMFGLRPVGDTQDGNLCTLAVGQSLVELRKAEKAGMHHYCYAVKDYDPQAVSKQLPRATIKRSGGDEEVTLRDPQDLVVELSAV